MAKQKNGTYSPEDMERYFNDPEFRRTHLRPKKESTRKTRFPYLLVPIGLILAGGIGYTIFLVSGLPSLERIENPKPELATKVFSSDGEVLDQYFIKNRSQVSINEIPQTVVNALIATEDKDFYSHWGVDGIRFIKAMIKNVIFFRREGASTITQQLSRNLYLGHEKGFLETINRKLREFMTSVQLERSFTKAEILEFYFNVVYFGRGSYGISAAAQQYFGKIPAELTLTEAATLIALLKGPSIYDPWNHPDRAVARRNIVLGQMEKYGYITPEVAAEATGEEIILKGGDDATATGIAPHYVEYIRQQLEADAEKFGFDIYRDGLSVYTTLDSRMQRYANRAVEEHLVEYQHMFDSLWSWKKEPEALKRVIDLSIQTSPEYRKAGSATARDSVYTALMADPVWIDTAKHIAKNIEVGFVALDPKTGAILAMVGGSNFRNFKYGLNHVTQIKRQVGSTFKPFVFTVAIDNNYPPTYELLNQPVTLIMGDGSRWTPENSDKRFGGKNTLREGLRKSINLIAVRAIMEIAPIQSVIDMAHRMGISSRLPPYESLALGAGSVSPLEMTSSFGVFANHGVHVDPISVVRIEDKDGNIIEENTSLKREVMSEETAFIMTTMLKDVVDHPEGTGLRVRNFFHYPAAGKTGSTNEFADAWFVGFTPQIVAGVWVGFDNMSVHFTNWDGQGGRAAAPIWGRFMKYVYEDPEIAMPLEYFEKPEPVFEERICSDTKKLATEYCPDTIVEYFTRKTLPPKCTKHTSSRWMEGEDSLGTISF
ncbi:MAG TPA: PBP1A family penicillin-binding protein [Bacteroidota bacterium]